MLSKQWGFISAKDATSVLLFARSAWLKVQEDKRSSRVTWYWSNLSDLLSVSCSDHDLSWVSFHPSIHHSTLVSSGAFKMHIVTSTIKQIYKLKAWVFFFFWFWFCFLQKLQGKIANSFFFPKCPGRWISGWSTMFKWAFLACCPSMYVRGVTILQIVTKKAHQLSSAGLRTSTKLAKPLKTHQVAGHSFRVRGSVRIGGLF